MSEEMFEGLEEELKGKFPLGIPRKKIAEATGGVLHPRTCANLDCMKTGIPGRFKIAKLTVYPVCQTVKYLKARISFNEQLTTKNPRTPQ